jgi:nucleoside-diphosphate-sugar epimerase
MQVAVTGATGFIGSAVVRALTARGHRVLPLDSRTGPLDRPDALVRAVRGCGAVVHAAFPRDGHDDLARTAELERAAVHALLAAATGPVIYTSGIGVLGDTGDAVVTEDHEPDVPPFIRWRRERELNTLAARHGIVIRPPLVYGHGSGLVPAGLARSAARRGMSTYPLPGENAIPTVHVDDLGMAYALAVEQAPPGTLLHVAAGASTPRRIAEAIGRLIGRPSRTTGLPVAQAREVMPFADWLGASVHLDCSRAHRVLGWRPTGPTIEEDLATGSYRRCAP